MFFKSSTTFHVVEIYSVVLSCSNIIFVVILTSSEWSSPAKRLKTQIMYESVLTFIRLKYSLQTQRKV